MTRLRVADGPWFRAREVAPGLTRIDEPHVDDLLQANIWRLRGRDRDLVVDAGLGVSPLSAVVPALFRNDPVLVLTHAHLDHTGGAAEFPDVRLAAGESGRAEIPGSLLGAELPGLLGLDRPAMPEVLIDALPSADFDPVGWRPPPLPPAAGLHDGDGIDLGDRRFEVLHLPGHTRGDIGLFDRGDGTLLTGDVLYEGELLDDLPESDVAEYVRSLRRILALPVSIVLPGHGDPFGAERMRELVHEYLRTRAG